MTPLRSAQAVLWLQRPPNHASYRVSLSLGHTQHHLRQRTDETTHTQGKAPHNGGPKRRAATAADGTAAAGKAAAAGDGTAGRAAGGIPGMGKDGTAGRAAGGMAGMGKGAPEAAAEDSTACRAVLSSCEKSFAPRA